MYKKKFVNKCLMAILAATVSMSTFCAAESEGFLQDSGMEEAYLEEESSGGNEDDGGSSDTDSETGSGEDTETQGSDTEGEGGSESQTSGDGTQEGTSSGQDSGETPGGQTEEGTGGTTTPEGTEGTGETTPEGQGTGETPQPTDGQGTGEQKPAEQGTDNTDTEKTQEESKPENQESSKDPGTPEKEPVNTPAAERPENDKPAAENPDENKPAEGKPEESKPSDSEKPGKEEKPEEQKEESEEEEEKEDEDPEESEEEDTDTAGDYDYGDTEFEMDEEDSPDSRYSSNEELIRAQHITVPPISMEFRFIHTDDAVTAILKKNAKIYEKKSENAKVVGVARNASITYILEECEDGCYYVESGSVRGFIRDDVAASGLLAENIISRDGVDSFPDLIPMVNPSENAALRYTKTTAYDAVVDKVYAVAKGNVSILEEMDSSSREVGKMRSGNTAYILKNADNGWLFVESGNVRGFVRSDDIVSGGIAEGLSGVRGETLAEETINPAENRALYYTITSTQEADQGDMLRENIVNFATSFVGKIPYVWGGTSLTTGADCSGFAQSVYAHFGYSLPRVACDQAEYGTQIPVSSARPGDLIFYASDGYVYHVSMYIGNGQVVHARGRAYGVTTSEIGVNAVWAVSLV